MFSSALKSFGSNILSNYQVSQEPVLISGPWKIHEGKKKSTGNAASIFIFDRKLLDPRTGAFGGRSSSTVLRKLHDEVVDRLKREISTLTRLRHPSVLQVLEPVEETRSGGLMFATEPVTASLAGLLREKDVQEGGSRASRYMIEEPDGRRRRRDIEIDELEIQKGLLQIAKGLEFLHESAGLVHGNLNPEAIFINAKSDWKIAGLAFASPPEGSNSPSNLPPLALSEVLYQDTRLPASVQLNLDYTSPDFVFDNNVTPAADLFSLGLIIIALYNSPHRSPIHTHGSIATYKKLLASPSTTPSQSNSFLCTRPIPKDLTSHVLPRLITRRPAQRLNARELQQSPYFDNLLVSTIRFLESFPAKTPHEKSQFLRGLQRVLPDFPASVLERKILGALLEETKDRELLSLILQNVFRIIKQLPNGRRVFPEMVVSKLRDIFLTGGNRPAVQERDATRDAGLMVVLEHMETIAENCPGKEFKEYILPLIQIGMESPTHSLVDAAMKCLPHMLPVLDFSTVKNEVFPPIASTFSKTNSLAIKIRGLESFVVLCGGSPEQPLGEEALGPDGLTGVLGDDKRGSKPNATSILDKYTVQEKLVPLLKAIRTKEPAVMMAALKVFLRVGQIVDTEFLALQVLPILWTFALGPLLNLSQFEQYMGVIRSFSSKVEREHSRKLKELSARDDGGATTSRANDDSLLIASSSGVNGSASATSDFERLVLGRSSSTSTNRNGLDILDSNDNASRRPASIAATTTTTAAPRTTAPAITSPTFSWSSTSRSITPDSTGVMMNNFPSLEPSRPGTGTASNTSSQSQFPVLQPTTASTTTTTTTTSSSSSSSQPLSSLSSLRNSLPATSSTSSTPTPNYAAFSIPPPPSTSSANPPISGFGPMPTGANMGSLNAWSGQTQNQNQNQNQGQPQGLDKYASLL